MLARLRRLRCILIGCLVARLIPEWRRAWRMASVQIAALAVIFGALPADQQAAILAWVGLAPERIPAAMGLAIIAARLLDQPRVRG